jgi:hypothetical protein
MHVSLSKFEPMAYFHEILYEVYGVGSHSNVVLFNFIYSIIVMWRIYELLR